MHKKLTPTQKLNALAAKFYNDAVWQPKAGDYYTSTRADLELYRVSRIEEGKIFTVYCHIECNEQGWNADDFTTKGFGLKRVHVPDWVFDIAPLDNLLDKPATVGAVTFHVGVSSKLVIEAAQRQYLRSQTPEEVQERLLKRDAFLKAINEGIGDESEPELKPCPFCGETPIFPNGIGTQYEIECDCGMAISRVQICDLMTIEERMTGWIASEMRYKDEFVQRAKQRAIQNWNRQERF